MSKKYLETQLKASLKKLQKTSAGIISTRGYTKENEKIKMLVELIKEQLSNESVDSATRKAA